MKVPYPGAIDCDIHLTVPGTRALLPFFDEFWREQILTRYIDRNPFTLMSYPPDSPASARADWRGEKFPGSDLDGLRRQALDPFGTSIAIANTLHGSVALFNEDLAAAFCSAVNDWVAAERLDKEPRLRASILVPAQSVEHAVREIERLAPDRRFVQIVLLVMNDHPLGRRAYWPIYQAAARHGLPVCLHAGSLYRHAPTSSGYPSYQVEDQVAQSSAFESQVVSFLAEGVFQKFPDLKLVLAESGFTWLPTLIWRTNKEWRGVRHEVPWLDEPPADIVRRHVRFTLQPLDLPKGEAGAALLRTLEHVGSDEFLLFSTDYPHWHFDGEDVLPDGLPPALVRKILFDNPRATYPRLGESADAGGGARQSEETVP
ncbi:MAG TPA: amidohydrolase family protein [Hyphomicrobiales bacterium]|nr:amidohydrolase family protein [Hyphomicrobiales bacterium]